MRVVVEADGGSRGNPGPAGYGSVVRDAATGEVLAERKGGLGVATNNVAEYTGMLEGLRAAAALGATDVDVRLDSKLVVEQMSSRWKIKNTALQPLAMQARDVAAGFDRIGYTWIPRAQNSHADRLANEAMDAQAAGDDPEQPGLEAEVVGGLPNASFGAPEATKDALVRPTPALWTGAQGTPTKLLLLRHGQTALSVDRRYSGRGDAALTDLGHRQAAAAAKRLAAFGDPMPVVSSPLGRARDTAAAVAEALGGNAGAVEEHPGFVETDFGAWEGLTFAEAAARDPELHARWLSDPSVAPPGGESFDAVHARVRRARDDMIARFGGRTVLVVSHVTPIKSLLRIGLDVGPQLLFRLHLDLASLSIVEFYPDGHASVRLVNDTSHLD